MARAGDEDATVDLNVSYLTERRLRHGSEHPEGDKSVEAISIQANRGPPS
jgi:hypothetical protein